MREQKVASRVRVATYWPRSREKGGFTCDEEQSSLLCELKSRGRSCVMSKTYPSAEALYAKAIDILLTAKEDEQQKENLSILYSNRSCTGCR